jgi:hypothetical protein
VPLSQIHGCPFSLQTKTNKSGLGIKMNDKQRGISL